MSRRPTRIEILTLWTAALGLLSVGVCCLGVPGAAAGWVSACHSQSGAAQCWSEFTAGCSMSDLAVLTDASIPGASETASPSPAAAAHQILPGPGVGPDLATMGGPGSTPPRDGTTAVYLLHSSFLL